MQRASMSLLGRSARVRARLAFSGARMHGGQAPRRPRSSAASNEAGATAQPNIQELAKMAQVRLSEQEAADWTPKIYGVLDWFGQLQSVDVSGVPPAIHAFSDGNRLRPDTAAHYDARARLLEQVPQTEGAYVRVPKTGPADAEPAAPAPAAKPAAAPVAPAAAAKPAPVASSSGSAAPSEAAPAATAPAAAADAAAAAAAAVPRESVHALDIRVGRIVSCERHPEADSLYVEQIDVGDASGPRTIVSGLVKYVPIEAMQDRLVLVICNLKPRNMRGIKSHGMLLAASDAPHVVVEPLVPPPGAKPGERVWFGDDAAQPAPADAKVVDKKKHWDAVQPALRTDGDCVALLAGVGPMRTAAGPVRSASLVDARIA